MAAGVSGNTFQSNQFIMEESLMEGMMLFIPKVAAFEAQKDALLCSSFPVIQWPSLHWGSYLLQTEAAGWLGRIRYLHPKKVSKSVYTAE